MINPGASESQGSKRPLRIFLCHASVDKPKVRALYQQLHLEGFKVWLDERDLLPGQDWQIEIAKAVRDSDVVIACLSPQSINKAGFVQKEIKFALDVADEQPEGAIFLIPVKLSECDVPERLSRWQWVNLFDRSGYERLVRSLRKQAANLDLATQEAGRLASFKRRLLSLRSAEKVAILVAIVALVIAALNWLMPFDPVGRSPFAQQPNTSTQTVQPTSTSTHIPRGTAVAQVLPTDVIAVVDRLSPIPSTPPATSTSTATSSPTPTATSSSTSTPTSTFMPSATPTRTPRPTSTKKPLPVITATPIPSGQIVQKGDWECKPSADQVSLFLHITGVEGCVTLALGNYPNAAAFGMRDDSVSRIDLGANVKAIVCEGENYSGVCETFTTSDYDIGDNYVKDHPNIIGNDTASSVRVIRR